MRTRRILPGVAACALAASAMGCAGMYSAKLSSDQVVPPIVAKDESGKAGFRYDPATETVRYKLTVKHLQDVTGAHIHLGPRDKIGKPVVPLFTGVKTGAVSGTLAEGAFTKGDFIGPLQGKTMADLMKAIQDGLAHVVVHTVQHPDGEIRGPIVH